VRNADNLKELLASCVGLTGPHALFVLVQSPRFEFQDPDPAA
jgi:hypothetical protein